MSHFLSAVIFHPVLFTEHGCEEADFRPELWNEPPAWAVVPTCYLQRAPRAGSNAQSWHKSLTCSFKSLRTLSHWKHKIEISPRNFILCLKANVMFLTLPEKSVLKLVRKKIKKLLAGVEVVRGWSEETLAHSVHPSG